MRLFSYLLVSILMILVIIFAVLNAQSVNVHYYFGSDPVPLSLLLAITLTLGAVIGLLAAFKLLLSLRRENHRLRQQVKVLQKELEQARVY